MLFLHYFLISFINHIFGIFLSFAIICGHCRYISKIWNIPREKKKHCSALKHLSEMRVINCLKHSKRGASLLIHFVWNTFENWCRVRHDIWHCLDYYIMRFTRAFHPHFNEKGNKFPKGWWNGPPTSRAKYANKLVYFETRRIVIYIMLNEMMCFSFAVASCRAGVMHF